MSIHSKVTRYGLVGAGARSFMFSDALLDIYQGTSSLVALCDVSLISDGLSQSQRLTVFPHWEKPWHVEIPEAVGGHGGGDLLLLEDLFGSAKEKDPLGRAAGHLDGARSVLTGIAANQSFATGQPVQIDQLLKI